MRIDEFKALRVRFAAFPIRDISEHLKSLFEPCDTRDGRAEDAPCVPCADGWSECHEACSHDAREHDESALKK